MKDDVNAFPFVDLAFINVLLEANHQNWLRLGFEFLRSCRERSPLEPQTLTLSFLQNQQEHLLAVRFRFKPVGS